MKSKKNEIGEPPVIVPRNRLLARHNQPSTCLIRFTPTILHSHHTEHRKLTDGGYEVTTDQPDLTSHD